MSDKTDLNQISRLLMSLERSKKPKMLVVDDEPDNLDLLYRTFRREFHVLRAESGVTALEMLATEGEVAVIISDQRMPEMKGTEFLSKTVPQFPDTMRIILTGFTDVEDLVEAINSGQVYKYITKPWNPEELKTVVHRAAETYDLLKQRTEELQRAQAQITLLDAIVQITHQSCSDADRLNAIAAAYREAFSTDICILQYSEDLGLAFDSVISSRVKETCKTWLNQDPLTQTVIQSKQMQVTVESSATPLPQMYLDAGIQAHLLVPVLFRERVLAVLSLQWAHPYGLREDELSLLNLSTHLVGIALSGMNSHHAMMEANV
ncbi:MAG TPA: response regulator [Trichocoleus sp.]|jgi:response regulator RpfG family c-di-GMP phosphodiesterase